MIAAALALADFGLALFPVAADCRSPLVKGGCHAASREPDQIRRWFSGGAANLACATGSATGAFVVDVDTKGGGNGFDSLRALEAAHGPIPATWATNTPSGGQHLWFRFDERVTRNRVGFRPGLDIRTSGGSVALPPSRRMDGVYCWKLSPFSVDLATAPEWLINMANPTQPTHTPVTPLRLSSADRAGRYVAAAVNDELDGLARCEKGGRNLRLFQCAANLGQFIGAGLLPEGLARDRLEQAAQECGLVNDDGWHSVRASIQSGLCRGIAHPREFAA